MKILKSIPILVCIPVVQIVASVLLLPKEVYAQRGSITQYEFGSVAMDYPVATGQSVGMQATLGQSFLFPEVSTNTAKTALGFWDTSVRYSYHLSINMDGFLGNKSIISFNARLWNTWGELSATEIVGSDTVGNVLLSSWANPQYIKKISVKSDRWLRKSSLVVGIINPFVDYPYADFFLLPGDIVDNNKVDVVDYNALRAAMGTRPGIPGWNPFADLDGDNYIGNNDYQLLRKYINKVGDQ